MSLPVARPTLAPKARGPGTDCKRPDANEGCIAQIAGVGRWNKCDIDRGRHLIAAAWTSACDLSGAQAARGRAMLEWRAPAQPPPEIRMRRTTLQSPTLPAARARRELPPPLQRP
jgi:hypothetical protein